jgi:hypothetical protein
MKDTIASLFFIKKEVGATQYNDSHDTAVNALKEK